MPKQATTKAAAGSKAARIAGAAAGVAGVMSPSGACNAWMHACIDASIHLCIMHDACMNVQTLRRCCAGHRRQARHSSRRSNVQRHTKPPRLMLLHMLLRMLKLLRRSASRRASRRAGTRASRTPRQRQRRQRRQRLHAPSPPRCHCRCPAMRPTPRAPRAWTCKLCWTALLLCLVRMP